MVNLISSLASIQEEYPEISQNQIASMVAEYIDNDFDIILKNVVSRIQLPSKMDRKVDEYRERRRKARNRISSDEKSEKEWLINILSNLKEATLAEQVHDDAWGTYSKWIGKHDAWDPQVGGQLFLSEINYKKYKARTNYKTTELADFVNQTKKDTTLIYTEIKEYSDRTDGVDDEGIRKIYDSMKLMAEQLSGNKLLNIYKEYHEDFGVIINITLEQNDKDAFNVWLKLIEGNQATENRAKIIVDWTLPNTLPELDFINKSVEVMIKAGLSPKLIEGFNAQKELDEWE